MILPNACPYCNADIEIDEGNVACILGCALTPGDKRDLIRRMEWEARERTERAQERWDEFLTDPHERAREEREMIEEEGSDAREAHRHE